MKRNWSFLVLAACAFAGGLAGTALLQNPALISAQTGKNPPPPPPAHSGQSPTQGEDRLGDRFEQVIRKTSPSVVAIEAIKPPAPSLSGKSKPVEESGSGVIVRIDGMRGTVIITNNHVISG